MSNSNLPVQFIEILKKEIPSNILNNIINNLPGELAKDKKLAKSIRQIENTLGKNNTQIEKFTEPNKKPKSTEVLKKKDTVQLKTVEAPISDTLSKLEQQKVKSKNKDKGSFSAAITSNKNIEPKFVPFKGAPGVMEPVKIFSDPINSTKKVGFSPAASVGSPILTKPVIPVKLPETGSLSRNNFESNKKTEEDMENEKEAEVLESLLAIVKKKMSKGKNKGKQIFKGKSLPAPVKQKQKEINKSVKDSSIFKNTDTLEYDEKNVKKDPVIERTLFGKNIGEILINMSGISGLFPTSLYSLSIQQLINYSLKAFGDLFIDITKNINDLSILMIINLLLKENRILYIGTGLFLLSVIMYIFNNFIKIPLSFGALLGMSGDKRVFVNNY
jgi:hypothetical protein